MKNQLARCLALVGLADSGTAWGQDGIIQVAPDPCIAGEPTTVCVTLCGSGSEVSSGTLNGTEVGVTTVDDNTVLLNIPSGAVQTGTNTLTLTKPDGTIGGVIGGIPPIGTPGGLTDFFAAAAHQITSLTLQRIEQKVQQGLALLIPDRPRRELAVGIETKRREMRQARIAGERTLRDLERTIDGLLRDMLRQHPGRETARAVRLAREQVRDAARTNTELINDTERRDRAYLEDQKGWMFDVGDIEDAGDAEDELEKKHEEEKERDKQKNDNDGDGEGVNTEALDQTKAEGDAAIANPPGTGWTPLMLAKIVTTAGAVMAGTVTPPFPPGGPGGFSVDVVEADGTTPADPYVAAGTPVPWIRVLHAERGNVKVKIHIDSTPPATATGTDPVEIDALDEETLQIVPPTPGDYTGGPMPPPYLDGDPVVDMFDGTITVNAGNYPPGTLIHIRVRFTHGVCSGSKDVLIIIQ